VELLTSEPTGDRPGELILENPDTGQHLDVDPAVVAAAIAATPAAPKTNEQQFLDEFDAARDINGKLLALRNYIARSVDAAQANRFAQERIREHMRLVYRGQAHG
jgi:hypothetical protein